MLCAFHFRLTAQLENNWRWKGLMLRLGLVEVLGLGLEEAVGLGLGLGHQC